MNEITIFGKITSEATLSANLTDEYRKLLQDNCGERVVMNLTVLTVRGTILQETYYRKVVLPCIIKGFKSVGDDMTPAEAHERVLGMCPATCLGTYPSADKDIDEKLTKQQWSDLIDWCIRVCSQNFGIIVPEPNEEP